ncbi:unnamed protein product [Pelagomonas calceolata]|uniref:Uncharacterized protein n=2 Tax=Pelagomonas calceolata TaxID=35677 RepID=A0A8J2X2I6_9STRA|nr:unnamed protein product [Pelagomonas calceolata]
MSHLLTTKKHEALDAAVAEASRSQRSTRPQEEEQTTPQERLWTAAEKGQLEVLRATCSEKVDLDARRPADGLAALHLACIRGSDGAVATLLRGGAAVTAEDASGRTALHAAAASDRANCCFALQKWGGRDFAIDAVDRDGRHALSLSAESGAARSAEELLRMGSDVHLRDKAGRTALHYACIDGNARVASILVRHGADPDAEDDQQRSPRHVALDLGRENVLRALDGDLPSTELAQQEVRKWRWVVVDERGSLVETNAHKVAVFRSRAAAAAWASSLQDFQVCELKEQALFDFETRVLHDRIDGGAEEARQFEETEDPVMAEFRRQEHAKTVSGAAADERKALEDLKAVEAKLDDFARRAEEARAIADMREHAVVDVFARSHELERSLEALKAELSTSEKGPDLIASLERLHQRGHPAAKPGADPRRLAAAAAELVSDDALPAWRAPDAYKAPSPESPERRSSRASELMQRLETKYAVPAASVDVAPPPDVVQARSATAAPERRAMPIQRFVPPASPSKAPEPPPSEEPASLRDLLEAARLGDKVDAFEDEEIDLEAILEAHRAGDLMDLLREVGLKAGERLRVKRALG